LLANEGAPGNDEEKGAEEENIEEVEAETMTYNQEEHPTGTTYAGTGDGPTHTDSAKPRM